jgi:hypothetical protein
MVMATKSVAVRVIRADRSGHFAGEHAVTAFAGYPWEARREVVIVNNEQVDSYAAFLHAVRICRDPLPEVYFFPPLAGGV